MNTTPCPHCHASIQAELVYCPYCLTRQTATFRPKEAKRDPYQILQVAASARPEAIEAAYRRLARMYHPDLNPNADADSRMKDINWARDILRDPIQRLDWDVRHGAVQREAASRPSAAPSPAPAAAARPAARADARVGGPHGPVGLPWLVWVGLAAIGLALSVALLPRANPAAPAATATGPAVTAVALA
ncbi:MAG: J domain-containing protein, partial [Anaerolineales bacterium]